MTTEQAIKKAKEDCRALEAYVYKQGRQTVVLMSDHQDVVFHLQQRIIELQHDLVLAKCHAERIRDAKEQAVAELGKAQANGDTEIAHSNADAALCKLLVFLGFSEVVEEWEKVDKWYV